MNPGFADRYYLEDGGYELAENEVAVDLFYGAGGTSEGLTKAIGEGPAFAVNQNPDAIGVHAVNHPSKPHLESDVFAEIGRAAWRERVWQHVVTAGVTV